MWKYQNTDELYHHGVLGMKWGVRRENKRQKSIDKYQKKYDTIKKKKGANSSKALRAKARLVEAQNSRYGKTNGKILADGVLRNIGIQTIAKATGLGILATGAAYTQLGLAALTGVAMANFISGPANYVSTVVGMIKNHKPKNKEG